MTVSNPTYDLVLLLDPDAEEETRARILADARGAIEANGEVLRHDVWGNRALSYPIQHRTRAEYHLLQFKAASTELLGRLNGPLRITDGVLRFRIIKLKPGVPEPPEMAGAGAASGGAGADSPSPAQASAGAAADASGVGAAGTTNDPAGSGSGVPTMGAAPSGEQRAPDGGEPPASNPGEPGATGPGEPAASNPGEPSTTGAGEPGDVATPRDGERV
jgi:small subunit ribosomal protein S6